MYPLVSLVTLAALLFCFAAALNVAGARRRHGIAPPVMTGHPEFERAVRVQANSLEWMMLFLPSLWLFAVFVGERWAAGIGVVWIVGRIVYMAGYLRSAPGRLPGFAIQTAATITLMLGAIIGAVAQLIHS